MKDQSAHRLSVSIVTLALLASAAPALRAQEHLRNPRRTAVPIVEPARLAEACALLDDEGMRPSFSGMFETTLLLACGRADELGGVTQGGGGQVATFGGTDVLVNNPAGDGSGSSRTQSETSIARSETSGILCAAYNDSYHGVVQGTGFTGFSHSANGGATWVDHGVVPIGGGGLSRGDPSTVWSRRDGTFYHTSLHSSGLGLWNLGSSCSAAAWVGMIHTGASDDKELMAVDNNPTSPYFGRLHVVWTNFADGRIYATRSDNGTAWSTPVPLSASGAFVQGAWPAVAPNGDLYVAWLRRDSGQTVMSIEAVRSTNGGTSFSFVTNPASNQTYPRDATATTSCGRPALKSNIRLLPSPQVAVDQSGTVHIVYPYDPDGFNSGDVVNVYYRRSTNGGSTWEPEIRLNDDTSTRDQWFPTLAVEGVNTVAVTWYDRRASATNTSYERYGVISLNGGASFPANERLSDVQSSVVLDPNLATCYHGDYDTMVADSSKTYSLWSDDRRGDADVYFDSMSFAVCGNGVREGAEQCDGSDLGGGSCGVIHCGAGTPTCTSQCTLEYANCSCCEEWINPTSNSGPTPGANTAFPQPLLIYDDLDATGSAGFFGAGCCSLGHQFSWSTGVKTGRARLVLGETSNAGTARAYYSLDSGTSWTQFGSTT
ncbi:MAG TPA: hypothetical protein VF139_04960, partial [Candidatus Polarisedimenticolaceae bacterium]